MEKLMNKEPDTMKALLANTVYMLCKDGLSFTRRLTVKGLIVVSIDEEAFVVQMDKIFCHDASGKVVSMKDHVQERGEAEEEEDDEVVEEIVKEEEEDEEESERSRLGGEENHRPTDHLRDSVSLGRRLVANGNEGVGDGRHIYQDLPSSSINNKRRDASEQGINGSTDGWATVRRGGGMVNPSEMDQSLFDPFGIVCSSATATVVKLEPPTSDNEDASELLASISRDYGNYLEQENDTSVMSSSSSPLHLLGVSQALRNAPSSASSTSSHCNKVAGGVYGNSRLQVKKDVFNYDEEGRRLKSFECQYAGCTKAFFRKDHLTRHQRIKHGKPYGVESQNVYKCCGKTFYKHRSLLKHIKETHPDRGDTSVLLVIHDNGCYEHVNNGRSQSVDNSCYEHVNNGHSQPVDNGCYEHVNNGHSQLVDNGCYEHVNNGHSQPFDNGVSPSKNKSSKLSGTDS